MRNRFDEQLALLNNEMIQMGALCEESIALAAKALTEAEPKLAKKVFSLADSIDQMERDIEGRCLRLLLQQQPVAKDLRSVSAALKMITDMERIGHQAADIADIATQLKDCPAAQGLALREMAAAAIHMVTDSVDAYVKQDVAMSEAVIAHDDIVDADFDKVKRTLLEWITKNPDSGESALDLLMVGKYFERIGDHAVNIAQWVIFSVTGVHKGELL